MAEFEVNFACPLCRSAVAVFVSVQSPLLLTHNIFYPHDGPAPPEPPPAPPEPGSEPPEPKARPAKCKERRPATSEAPPQPDREPRHTEPKAPGPPAQEPRPTKAPWTAEAKQQRGDHHSSESATKKQKTGPSCEGSQAPELGGASSQGSSHAPPPEASWSGQAPWRDRWYAHEEEAPAPDDDEGGEQQGGDYGNDDEWGEWCWTCGKNPNWRCRWCSGNDSAKGSGSNGDGSRQASVIGAALGYARGRAAAERQKGAASWGKGSRG